MRELFERLFDAETEVVLQAIVDATPGMGDPENWAPYGGNPSNYAVVENQQSAPVPSLVEKITNAIDALLMRACLEGGVEPTAADAPRSVQEAVLRFFPTAGDWDLRDVWRRRAPSIQILATGSKRSPNIAVYDEGEGQHPDDFERTFLSLLRGNKNAVHFVQGKYNMGGSGALVFAGKCRFQLVVSRRYDGGPVGFTLLRRHPLSDAEVGSVRNTWYEYFKPDGRIPRFDFEAPLDLGLHERLFETGSLVKLYSFALPSGALGGPQELRGALNEYLFEPALPFLVVDTPERYPNNKNLDVPAFGLKRRLEHLGKYVEKRLFWVIESRDMGRASVTAYVFRARVDGKNVKETRGLLNRHFFKSGMRVLFSINGQVHGHFTQEFITRSLKMPLLKHHLLVHVDCTEMELEYRNELFMASRDRLKKGEESRKLRDLLRERLRNSELKAIHKARRSDVSDDTAPQDLVKKLGQGLPLAQNLMRLLGRTVELPNTVARRRGAPKESTKDHGAGDLQFQPKRYPTELSVRETAARGPDGKSLFAVPKGGGATIRMNTNAEDGYFDRSDDPGEFSIGLLKYSRKEARGGDAPGLPDQIADVLAVTRAGPTTGKIRIHLDPTREVEVGDMMKLRVTLGGEHLEAIFWVRITEPRSNKKPKKASPEVPNIALPELVVVRRVAAEEGQVTWDDLADQCDFSFDRVMFPSEDEEGQLNRVYVNADSTVLLSYLTQRSSEESRQAAIKKYIATVYFHTVFMYAIASSREYVFSRGGESESEELDLADYLVDMFDSNYAEFLLTFDTGGVLELLD